MAIWSLGIVKQHDITFDRMVFTGRMQMLQNMHVYLIDQALEVSEQVAVLLGSAQLDGTPGNEFNERNPFSVETRSQMLQDVFADRIIIHPLRDTTHENDITYEWGQHVKEESRVAFGGEYPDAMIYGNDEERNHWFSPHEHKYIDMVKVKRLNDGISGTAVRKLMAEGRYHDWKQYTPKQIHHRYEQLKEELLRVEYYRNINL